MPPIALYSAIGVAAEVAVARQVVREHDLVAERQQRELVFLLQRRHEVLRAGDDVRLLLLHAAARVEREHDGDVLDGLLERLERLDVAIFETSRSSFDRSRYLPAGSVAVNSMRGLIGAGFGAK